MSVQANEHRDILATVQRLVPFLWTQRIAGYDIPEMPHFDDGGTAYFLEALNRSSFYLEYGSGGSTVLAARLKKHFISVDSDKHFLRAVRKRIKKLDDAQVLLHADVGINGPWGIPLFKAKTPARLRRWADYPDLPWRTILAGRTDLPDLVLVDGRFRVACALTAFKYLKDSPNAVVLVDDYCNRPNFTVIEQFGDLTDTAGRMGVFRPRRHPVHGLDDCLRQHLSDWR